MLKLRAKLGNLGGIKDFEGADKEMFIYNSSIFCFSV